MSTHFDLTLDTIAPSVTLGTVTGANAGSLLDAEYTTDEAIARATLTLGDNRVLDVTVTGSDLTVLLPDDTPNGVVTFRFYDDVENSSVATLEVVGVIVVPEPVVVPAGRPSQAPTPRRIVSRARARASARYTIGVRTRTRTVASTSSSYTIRRAEPAEAPPAAPPPRRELVSRTSLATNSTWRIEASSRWTTRATVSSSYRIIRRTGPSEEEALLVLDLL